MLGEGWGAEAVPLPPTESLCPLFEPFLLPDSKWEVTELQQPVGPEEPRRLSAVAGGGAGGVQRAQAGALLGNTPHSNLERKPY